MLELGDKDDPTSNQSSKSKSTESSASVGKRVRATLRRILSDGKMLAKHLALPADELLIASTKTIDVVSSKKKQGPHG